MNIDYRSHYFDDATAKASFKRYADRIFGLDFGRWEERGLWSDRYIPFSAFSGDECIASICVYGMNIIIEGRDETWAQLLTVGTLPEYRRRGIQRELWRRTQRWVQDNCSHVFLFTDDSAAGFYEKLGFKRQPEYYDVIKLSSSSPSTAELRFRRLDVEDNADFAILSRLADGREPVSNRLGFRNPKLLLFMLLYPFRDWIYFLPEMDTVIVAETSKERLRIHDILAVEMPGIGDIEQFLRHFQKRDIEFLFCTDRLGMNESERREVKDSILFVDADFELEGEFVFPSSIRA
jgi:ribosomal protein S18 acetylase RimI-like enzyme